MTSIFVASDLHVDFLPDHGKSLINSFPKTDIGVFAGDLCQWQLLEQTLTRLCGSYEEVVYVLGNHEYYTSDWQSVENIVRDMVSKLGNLTWLNDNRVKINGVNFVGGTLWFPDSVDAKLHKAFLNDYRMIGGFEAEVYARHSETCDSFYDPVNGIMPGDIVVTHHAPSLYSIHPRFLNSKISCYFCNDLDYIIKSQQPSIWIHGHTHDAMDYYIEDTRVICNPQGYPSENGCDKGLILEV